jgi:hypothetical protein
MITDNLSLIMSEEVRCTKIIHPWHTYLSPLPITREATFCFLGGYDIYASNFLNHYSQLIQDYPD